MQLVSRSVGLATKYLVAREYCIILTYSEYKIKNNAKIVLVVLFRRYSAYLYTIFNSKKLKHRSRKLVPSFLSQFITGFILHAVTHSRSVTLSVDKIHSKLVYFEHEGVSGRNLDVCVCIHLWNGKVHGFMALVPWS